MKKVMIGVVVLLVVVGGVGVYVFLNAGSIIKQVVEKVGGDSTQTKVVLTGVDLSIQTGEASLNGFAMGNPKGFKSEKAMAFDRIKVKIDPATVTNDVILVKEVVIEKPEITYEFLDQGSNFDTIKKNVDAYAQRMGAGGNASSESAEAKGSKKVIIENFYMRDGKIVGSVLGQSLNLPLPDIHIRDIGKATNGAVAADVAKSILNAINRNVAKAVADLGLDALKDKAKGAMGDAQKMIESGGGDAKKMMEDSTKGVGDALKGVFGK